MCLCFWPEQEWGHLHLVDFDKVEMSNLNRQHYFISHLGMDKTEALKEQLLQINPWLDIKTSCERVTEENIPRLFQNADIICEAFDSPENKAMLVNSCLELFPEKPLVCASGMAGFGRSNAIVTRQVGKNFYLCGDGVSGLKEGQGLAAPRVALCAAHEAKPDPGTDTAVKIRPRGREKPGSPDGGEETSETGEKKTKKKTKK